MNKKIAILGLHSDYNLGDPLICQTVIKLIDQFYNGDITISKIDLRYYHSQLIERIKNSFLKYIFLLLHWSLKLASKSKISIIHNLWIVYLSYEMERLLINADSAIIAGGGIIHYKYHNYYSGICSFILACQRKKVPVFINAVGIEGFDKENPKCKMLSKFLNYPIVKYISTRDDMRTLKDEYIDCRNSTPIVKVSDPVILCSKLFSINAKPNSMIGIGLIRENIFQDYKVDANPDILYNFYCALAQELDKWGLKYEFFTNGLKEDLDIIHIIEKKLNRSIQVRVPNNVIELLSIIASYRGIITARMHSCIVAYSFNIPAVAINWNNKVAMWFNNINKADCCFDLDKLAPSAMIEKLLELENKGYEKEVREKLEKEYMEMFKSAIETIDPKTTN